jgi:hypothetical protein
MHLVEFALSPASPFVSSVGLEDLGVLDVERVGSLLANADVQLFVRSAVSSRRGSGIAGIACIVCVKIRSRS